MATPIILAWVVIAVFAFLAVVLPDEPEDRVVVYIKPEEEKNVRVRDRRRKHGRD